MPFTDAEKQAYARVGIDVVELWAIELRHTTFPSHVRIVNYDLDVSHTLEASAPVDAGIEVLFSALAFQFVPPKVSEESVNKLTAQIDGVPGTVQPFLATALQTSESIEATFRELIYDLSTQAVLQQPSTLHLRVLQAKSTAITVVLEAGRINSANQVFPGEDYTPSSNPGLEA